MNSVQIGFERVYENRQVCKKRFVTISQDTPVQIGFERDLGLIPVFHVPTLLPVQPERPGVRCQTKRLHVGEQSKLSSESSGTQPPERNGT